MENKILDAVVTAYSEIKWRVIYFCRSINNLIVWLPIIWKDRNWDQWYIYTILETKLRNQAKYISKRDLHTRAQYDSEKMLLCANLIKKIKNEDFNCEYLDYHVTEFHFDDAGANRKSLRIEEITNNFNDYFLKHPLEYKRVMKNPEKQVWRIKDAHDTQKIAMNISHNRQVRAQRLLFELLNKHINCWWD